MRAYNVVDGKVNGRVSCRSEVWQAWLWVALGGKSGKSESGRARAPAACKRAHHAQYKRSRVGMHTR